MGKTVINLHSLIEKVEIKTGCNGKLPKTQESVMDEVCTALISLVNKGLCTEENDQPLKKCTEKHFIDWKVEAQGHSELIDKFAKLVKTLPHDYKVRVTICGFDEGVPFFEEPASTSL